MRRRRLWSRLWVKSKVDRYRPRKGRIFGGIFLLILAGFVLWFIAVGYLIYTPFAKMYAVRGVGGYYVEGKITEIVRRSENQPSSAENGGDVILLRTEYWIGLQRHKSTLPADIFYYDGLEEGDSIYVPFSQEDFDDMSREDKITVIVAVILFVIFLSWGIRVLTGEIAAVRYFKKLIFNKTYINAHIDKSEHSGNRSRAICSYGNHRFESRWYSKESYPFKRGGEVRVYVDLLKNPHKYLVSDQ